MAPGTCPRCGGPNPEGTGACAWCGGQLPRDGPGLQQHAVPSAGSADARSAPSTDWKPVVLRVLVLAVVLAVVISVLALGPFLPVGPSSAPITVEVTGVTLGSPDHVCGLNQSTLPGFVASPNESVQLTWYVPDSISGQGLPCTISSVSTNQTGFSVSADVPKTVASRFVDFPLDVHVPAVYVGPLVIELA
jgi:hypothetical protein